MGIKKKASQNDLVLAYIRAYGSITTLEAFRDLGITRLSARIYDLSRAGHKFKREMIAGKNRFGDKVYFSRYSLEKPMK